MIYTNKELQLGGETEYSIRKKVSERKIFLIERGIYSSEERPFVDEAYLSKKYGEAILTGPSALYVYELVDQIPDKFHFSTLQHSFPIRRDDVAQSYQDPSFFLVGKTTMKYGNGSINIYDLERTLIELIRLREKLPPELYYESIRSFRKIKDKLDFFKINKYLKHFKNGELLLQRIKEAM